MKQRAALHNLPAIDSRLQRFVQIAIRQFVRLRRDSGANPLQDKKPTQVMTAWAIILFGFLVQQSHQRCLRLLLHAQHLPEVGLRGCERGLFILL